MSGSTLPNLILPGVGKAGTTSLFWYLSQHPQICASRPKETMYFVPLSEVHADASGILPPIQQYARHFDRWNRELYRMEATPHYFHGGPRLVNGLAHKLPGVRILVTLRDPVSRAWSIYRFGRETLTLPDSVSFETFIERGLALRESGAFLNPENAPYWTSITGSMYADFMSAWIDAFEGNLHVVFFEEFVTRPRETLADICDWLGLDYSCLAEIKLSVENRTVAVRSRLLHRIAVLANGERGLRNRRGLKAPLRQAYWRVNGRSEADHMPSAVENDLEILFRDSNARLVTQLATAGVTNHPAWLARHARNAGDAETILS